MTQEQESITYPDETMENSNDNEISDKDLNETPEAKTLREKKEQENLNAILERATPVKDPSELKKDLNISDYSDVDSYQTVQILINNAINDPRQKRLVKLATLDKYKIMINVGNDNKLPEWHIIEFEYFPVTTGAWNERRNITAKIDDMSRVASEEIIGLMEYDLLVRQRRQIMNQINKNTEKLDALALQESKSRTTGNQSKITKDLQEKIQNLTVKAQKLALEIYFHVPPQVYDRLNQEQMRDIIEACDLKQSMGVPNLANQSITQSMSSQTPIG